MTEERSIDAPSNSGPLKQRVLRSALFVLAGYVLVSEVVSVIQTVLAVRRFDVELATPVGINAQYWIAVSLTKVALASLFLLGWRWMLWLLLAVPIVVSALTPLLGYGMQTPWFQMLVLFALLAVTFAHDRGSLRPFRRRVSHAERPHLTT